MNVIIAGCWRTGTTAVYNIARLILSLEGEVYSCFVDEYDYVKAEAARHTVIKVHKFSNTWLERADKIITTYRDSRDILDSMQRFKGTGGSGNASEDTNIIRGLEHWGLWQQHTNYLALFNRLTRSPAMLVSQIAGTLGVKISNAEVYRLTEEFQNIKPPLTGVDPITLLHHNHITKQS